MWIIIISLLLIGLALLVVEIIFIPGATVVGLLGVAFSIAGVVVGYREFGNETGFYILMTTLVVTGAALYYSFRSGAWRKFSLRSSIDSKVNEGLTESLAIGDIGITVSSLRPSGKANFHDKVFEVRTQGNYVEPGTKVKIIQIQSQQILVEPLITNLI